MAPSKLVLKFFFSSSLLVILSSVALAKNSNVFTEYIGHSHNGVTFTDVPINSGVQFNFMLAYALDQNGTGQFQIWWQNTVLTPEAVDSIKASNPNVTVGLSLGHTFSAESIDSWVGNAFCSLFPIIRKYHIDAIDIKYDKFDSDVDTFAQCIGKLITILKIMPGISFASITPHLNENVQKHYKKLYDNYSPLIDYVNFPFYEDKYITKAEFLAKYDEQVATYGPDKLLAGVKTDTGLTPSVFFDACKELQGENKLFGIYVWSADGSKRGDSPFQYEIAAQQLLADYQNVTEAYHLKLLSNA